MLCGRNREALEELTKELAASLTTKVSLGVCFPWARGAVCRLQAPEEIAWAAARAGHPRGHSVPREATGPHGLWRENCHTVHIPTLPLTSSACLVSSLCERFLSAFTWLIPSHLCMVRGQEGWP